MTTIPPYDFQRSSGPPPGKAPSSVADSMDYSEPVDEQSQVESYVAASSILTASPYPYPDATRTVHEMHLALLYLLSNPEEFQRALTETGRRGGATTLAEWNMEYDNETVVTTTTAANMTEDHVTAANPTNNNSTATPLPYVVFADDAEVVLPQAHTASQLFGVERIEGIELEAAAGIGALSQLFLRWLALMPNGDHLNIIDPPGLTVMRIAGGRYRVTAAHRVVWQWMNEFAKLDGAETDVKVGDYVTMTIVDVFETDNHGKLLSYCPTFDNRDIRKTTQTAETLRKSSSRVLSQLSIMAKSQTAVRLNKGVAAVTKMGVSAAKSVAGQVNDRLKSPARSTATTSSAGAPTAALDQLDVSSDSLPPAAPPKLVSTTTTNKPSGTLRADAYISGDDSTIPGDTSGR